MPDSPELLLEARRFRVERITQTMPDGSRRPREVVRHPGAVCILPLLDGEDGERRVCLIENVRPAVGRTLLELPAGTLEPGEDPRETAIRELAEETGYRAARVEPLVEFFTSPGFLDERMYAFVATRLSPGPTNLDEGEDIATKLVAWDEAMELVRQGLIEDGKTLATLLWYGMAGETRREAPGD